MAQELIQAAQPTFLAELVADLERLGYSTFAMDGEMSSNPILALDSSSGNAFLLHHVLGYKIEEGALLLEMSEVEFRAQLGNAYLQLASHRFESDVHLSVPAEPAMA